MASLRMSVVKRDGKREFVNFDKITTRIERLCWPLGASPTKSEDARVADDALLVDASKIAATVCASVVDGITTERLDELTADAAAGMSTEHPDYGVLAARIVVSNLQKQTSDDVLDTYERMASLLDPTFLEHVRANRDAFQAMVHYDRDFDFDYFGFKTMEKLYLTKVHDKIVERPQHMFLRVAVAIWGSDVDRVKETYDALSVKMFTHASPTLFNAGLKNQQLSSCFLLGVEDDSIAGIYDALTKCAHISKYGGGIGMHISNVRCKGSKIRGTNGESDGIVPMAKVFDATAAYVNQGGRRKGAIALYLEPHHPDVFEFLDLKRNQGEDSLRARNLFYAMWLPDLFMKRVEADGVWSLFDPAECPDLNDLYGDEFEVAYERLETQRAFVRQIKAQDLWTAIVRSQIETGGPYILFKDAANQKSNQKNLGTIKCSNLCVAGDTRILTSTGYHRIKDVVGKNVRVWNGEEFSETTVMRTGRDQPLVTVTVDNGTEIRCTPYHKFFVETASRPSSKSRPVVVRACDLEPGDRIVKHDLPTIVEGAAPSVTDREAYTAGFFCADGYLDASASVHKISVHRVDKKKALEKRASFVSVRTWRDRNTYVVDRDIVKYEVPVNSSPAHKLRWLEGYMDGDGTVIRNDGIENIQAASINREFLTDVRLMLQTIGVDSTVTRARVAGTASLPGGEYDTKELWRIQVGSSGLRTLMAMGFSPARLEITGGRPRHHDTHRFARIVSVEDHGDVEDTFCFNEPKKHAGMFEGILAGNCTEIMEYTSKDEIAVCTLGSLSLPAFVLDTPDGPRYDFESLMRATKILARNLDRIIDINFYPLQEAKNSNERHRPVGIGVQGLANVFFEMKMPFDSPEAAELNRNIFETIYYGSLLASNELAEAHGPYSSYAGSPASLGKLQYDLWKTVPTMYWDWEGLKASIAKHGLRNSLSVAPMPTASTAQFMSNVEAMEPQTSNLYSRRTLAGEFPVINTNLVRELIARGTWDVDMKNKIVAHGGSIQKVIGIHPSVKAVYKTAWELSMKSVIDMAADRGAFVCQSQSLNCFVAEPTMKSLSSMHFYAWRKGLKTGCYYLRTKAASSAIKVTTSCLSCSG